MKIHQTKFIERAVPEKVLKYALTKKNYSYSTLMGQEPSYIQEIKSKFNGTLTI